MKAGRHKMHQFRLFSIGLPMLELTRRNFKFFALPRLLLSSLPKRQSEILTYNGSDKYTKKRSGCAIRAKF
jgi:hypothetical protein